jgi:S1-C subfamily serine protease
MRHRQIAFHRLIFAALLISLAGCAHLATNQEKQISYRRFEPVQIAGIQLGDYLRQRTAYVVAGARPDVVAMAGEAPKLQWEPASRDDIDLGFATAISGDGYFLTAAHCVPREPVFLIIRSPAWMNVIPARVVWSPMPGSAFDIAILKVNVTIPWAFDPADVPQFHADDDIVTIGANGLAGGKILGLSATRVPATAHNPATLAVYHTAPLAFGDSGGPLTTADGKLIGIEVLARGAFIGPMEGIALRPDVNWVERMILEDRASHPTTRPSASIDH